MIVQLIESYWDGSWITTVQLWCANLFRSIAGKRGCTL